MQQISWWIQHDTFWLLKSCKNYCRASFHCRIESKSARDSNLRLFIHRRLFFINQCSLDALVYGEFCDVDKTHRTSAQEKRGERFANDWYQAYQVSIADGNVYTKQKSSLEWEDLMCGTFELSWVVLMGHGWRRQLKSHIKNVNQVRNLARAQ